MTKTLSDIQLLLKAELATIVESNRHEMLKSYLVLPELFNLEWDYGKDGEQFGCWLVARSTDGKQRLVYCDRGFGPSYPWGIGWVWDEGIGSDGQWFARLEDAAIGIGLLPAPPHYEVP